MMKTIESQFEPRIKLMKRRKYCSVEYDFWRIDYDLKEEMREVIEKIIADAVRKSLNSPSHKKKGGIWYSVGTTFGYVSPILIHIGEWLISQIRPILLDKKNWRRHGCDI